MAIPETTCQLCKAPSNVERHGAALPICSDCLSGQPGGACIACSKAITAANCNIRMSPPGFEVLTYCADCFEHLDITEGRSDDGRRAWRIEGYYRRSIPGERAFCKHLDPRMILDEWRPKIRLDLERIVANTNANTEDKAAFAKLGNDQRMKVLTDAAKSRQILASPKKLEAAAMHAAKSAKHHEARAEAQGRLATLIANLTRGTEILEPIMELQTNARTGYHGFKVEVVEAGGEG